jgi:hypothetical protein
MFYVAFLVDIEGRVFTFLYPSDLAIVFFVSTL